MNLEYYKTFLWPTEDFLSQISFKEGDIWCIDIIPYRYKSIEDGEKSFYAYNLSEIEKIRRLWMENYKVSRGLNSLELSDFEKSNEALNFTNRFLFALGELIKNTFEHGNKEKKGALAFLGSWITENGIIIGVKDEGVFYSDPEVAKKVEERIIFESTKEDPTGAGLGMMYEDADFLQVVTEQDALFAGFLFNSKT